MVYRSLANKSVRLSYAYLLSVCVSLNQVYNILCETDITQFQVAVLIQ